MRIPEKLKAAASEQGRAGWLDRLPGVVADLEWRWSLKVGPPFEPGGSAAWVAPVRSPSGDDLVLKLVWPHDEAAHEADGLAVWAGDGAVRLHRCERLGHTDALLLEHCSPGTQLASRPGDEQDVVVAGLLGRLWRADPGPPFRRLSQMCGEWADQFDQRRAQRHPLGDLDPGLVELGVSLFRTLPREPCNQVLLCTDLHGENVLAAEREPWLAIDPKPYVGDPCYDLLQHMLNRIDRDRADPVALAARMAGLVEVDAERVRLWLFARCVIESLRWPAASGAARLLMPTG